MVVLIFLVDNAVSVRQYPEELVTRIWLIHLMVL